MPRALLALAIGAFGIGTTEFVVMGMLPEIAAGLDVSVSAVGLLISAYAIGVVVGAPTLTALGLRFTPRQTLVALMVVFVVGNLLAACAPTYGTLAAKVGAPRAARAVGMVMNRNPIPIVLPCHRVVGSNGSLTGYAGGLDVKERLLRLEGALL